VALTIHVARTWDRTYDLPLVDLRATTDPEMIRRGEYLVYGTGHCSACHVSSYEAYERLVRGEPVPLAGGLEFKLGPLGVMYSKNLTPDPETGIGRYSDGQLARMMRNAVRPDGRASIWPMMPFGNMSDEDVVAILSFLRAQAPVRHEVPAEQWTLMGKVLKSFISTALPHTDINPPKVSPPQAPTRERGEYLARNAANCVGCHTPRDPMTFVPIGPEFAGGFEVEPSPLPGVDTSIWFLSPNLTPAPGSALLKFPDRDTWVARFRKGGRVHAGSPMPWEQYARMDDADIGAMYEYFRSLPAAAGPTGDPTFRRDP
jgi:mono/diheme cytochrome c family protein